MLVDSISTSIPVVFQYVWRTDICNVYAGWAVVTVAGSLMKYSSIRVYYRAVAMLGLRLPSESVRCIRYVCLAIFFFLLVNCRIREFVWNFVLRTELSVAKVWQLAVSLKKLIFKNEAFRIGNSFWTIPDQLSENVFFFTLVRIIKKNEFFQRGDII